MKKVLPLFMFFLSIVIHAQSIELKFIDEYILKDSLSYSNSIIGGLSGIDKEKNYYYMVVDDSNAPRVLKSRINFEADTIKSVDFLDVIRVDQEKSKFLNNSFLDLESIFVVNNDIYITSEGSINKSKDPSVFSINNKGEFLKKYKIPKYFKSKYFGGPRHNAVFEASSKGFNKKGFWVANEGVLKADGEEAGLKDSYYPARVTFFNYKKKKAIRQFVYPLEKLNRPIIGRFNVNGITALIEYKENHFFVIERTYQSGYGKEGNKVKIFNVVLTEEVVNTLNVFSLKEKTALAVKKELLFDFDDIRSKLFEKSIDNIEGITFGPTLSNGNQSLIVIADDNFQKFGKQLNQFIVLEIKK